MGRAGAPDWKIPSHKITAIELLKLQAAGRLPGPAPLRTLEWQLRQMKGKARPHYHFHSGVVGVRAWSDYTNYGYLLGLSGKFATVDAIDVATNGCYDPSGIKVDHYRNVWVACELGSSLEAGAVQEYPAGALANTYSVGCPSNIAASQCSEFFSESFDQFEGSHDVFATLASYENCYFVGSQEHCGEGEGFEYWPSGNPGAQPTLIDVTNAGTNTVSDMDYADMDSTGNIWFDYYGCENVYPFDCGYGIGEVTSPTTSPSVISIADAGTLGFAGGVYTSNQSSRVWVTDQVALTTTEWTGGIAGTLIGPTSVNVEGQGDPVAGGFNRNDTMLGLADGFGWVDACTAATSACTIHPNADMPNGAHGFAYLPSDK